MHPVTQAAPQSPDHDITLTTAGVAELLQISERMVAVLRQQGLPSCKIGSCVRFWRNDVIEWANNHLERTPARPEGGVAQSCREEG